MAMKDALGTTGSFWAAQSFREIRPVSRGVISQLILPPTSLGGINTSTLADLLSEHPHLGDPDVSHPRGARQGTTHARRI